MCTVISLQQAAKERSGDLNYQSYTSASCIISHTMWGDRETLLSFLQQWDHILDSFPSFYWHSQTDQRCKLIKCMQTVLLCSTYVTQIVVYSSHSSSTHFLSGRYLGLVLFFKSLSKKRHLHQCNRKKSPQKELYRRNGEMAAAESDSTFSDWLYSHYFEFLREKDKNLKVHFMY